jgi:hypothetical protein
MHTTMLLTVTIIDRLRTSCSENLSLVPFMDLNPDKTNSLNILGKAIGTLECYFTDPLAENPS